MSSPAPPALEQRWRTHLLGHRAEPLRGGGRVYGWLGPLVATLIGGLLRFWNLGFPHQLVFDETYYVKQGWSMILFGVEIRNNPAFGDQIDQRFTAGTPNIYGTEGDMVVHGPVGKWMIGAGEWLFGIDNSFGWRFTVCVLGTLAILVTGRLALRLTGSPTLATLAALLLAFEGHEFVHSRTGLLDLIVMWWALIAFYLLVIDRDAARARLARKVAAIETDGGLAGLRRMRAGLGPSLGARPWRIAAAVAIGLCAGTKWSGAYFLVAFGLMSVFWDLGARRAIGIRHWIRAGLLRDGIPAGIVVTGIAIATYLASWTGWFLSSNGYNRQWAATNPAEPGWGWVPGSLRSLWNYHGQILRFHESLETPHPWQSNPWSWLIQGRPTLFFAENPDRGVDGCTIEHCTRMIHSIGTLTVWWGGFLAIFVLIFLWVLRRDWRAGAILWGLIGGYLPWFLLQDRTIFAFYTVAFVPYMVLAVTMCLGLIIGDHTASLRRRRWGVVFAGVVVIASIAQFAWFYPLYTAQLVSRDFWWMHMWFPSWV